MLQVPYAHVYAYSTTPFLWSGRQAETAFLHNADTVHPQCIDIYTIFLHYSSKLSGKEDQSQ